MFLAGQASAGATPGGRWSLRNAAFQLASMAAVALISIGLTIVLGRPAPQVVERVVYLPVESAHPRPALPEREVGEPEPQNVAQSASETRSAPTPVLSRRSLRSLIDELGESRDRSFESTTIPSEKGASS